MSNAPTMQCARSLDANDPLKTLRQAFLFPQVHGKRVIYLCGNSLGLQPKKARAYVEEALSDWGRLGVEGHHHARHPWLPYHENLTAQTARLVGALPHEVVVMNTLTVNLHLMMVSFYRPQGARTKILMEAGAFPSDQYAVASQVRWHGLDPVETIIEVAPRPGETILRTDDILATLEQHGARIALVLLGGVHYLTGQALDMAALTTAARAAGCCVGFDLAHAAGNIPLSLHDWGPDFAAWCSYKYLNGGPGTLAGCFVHERHAHARDVPRFAGWWGHDKASRFAMGPNFVPIPGAEGWQLSNPPILQLAALRAAMELFDTATMARLRTKSIALTNFLAAALQRLAPGFAHVITPHDSAQRGAQLSLRVTRQPELLQKRLKEAGVICDVRAPDVIRVAPVPLYNSFADVYRFAQILAAHANVSQPRETRPSAGDPVHA